MIYRNLEHEGEKNQPMKPIEGEKELRYFTSRALFTQC